MPEVRKLWQTEDLFSDHYLKSRLSKNDWWPSDAEAQPIWEFCKALYEKRAFALRRYDNEMGVRQEFIDKIIEKLGFAWSDNLRLPETQQDLEPDYLLYASEAEKEAVLNKDVSHRYRAAIAILEAKKFGHPLSQISKSQQRYPHQQIRDYLNEAQVLTWGILTNGNEWRLYCRDTKPSHFFAINFELAIHSLDEFKFFLALFSPAAFVRDAQGKCRLDQVRESALATQSELEADLRQRIFTIVEILANGFAERPENKIADADLPRLYENCLIFLYRLLFILYAEGRSLLPVEPKSGKYYKQLSLARLLTPLKNFTEYDSQTQTRFYRDIQALCLVINGTDKKANDEFRVPRYNGGLFDPDHYPLLTEWAVADAVLADVLRQLMFTPEKGGQKFVPFESVDYSDLSVQQLGSIYEGLLEHHFVREGGKLVLQTDKAERKATGTYYTPDYVVKYIVEQTITPLLQEIEQREPVKAARVAGRQDNSFADEVLKLNICDPAMGSGHFLVEATTFLADHIVYHPTTKFQAEFVKGESQEKTEDAHWRRRVVEACIYGVDLNPLAVELAKLSLWLTTIATDQPLNFLDHHLCCGNSLIGARLEDLSHVPDKKRKPADSLKLSWRTTENLRASLTKAVQMVHNIEGAASASVSDVKNKEKLWLESVRPALLPFRTVANLWTACFFGNELPQKDYEALIELLDIHPDKIHPWQNAAEFQAIAMEAVKKGSLKLAGQEFDTNQLKNLCAFLFRSERSATERRFFHWELEFPEVFFNDDGTPRDRSGFDAIIGNPPYIDIKGLESEMVDYIFATYETAHFRINIFAAFLEHELGILRSSGNVGAIIPTAFLTQVSYAGLRQQVLQNDWLRNVVRLPNELFGAAAGEVKVDTCIIVIRKSTEDSEPNTECLIYQGFQRIPRISRDTASTAFVTPQAKWLNRQNAEITLSTGGGDTLLTRIESKSVSLEKLCEFCLGLTPYDKYTGHTEAQIKNRDFHAKSKIDATCQKLLVSGDVKRYEVEWNGEEWIRYGDWLAAPRERRFFTEERVLVQQIIDWSSLRILCGWTNEELYNTQNQFNLLAREGTNLKFVVAVLNSQLMSFYHRRVFLDVALQRFQKVLIKDAKTFPICQIVFTTSEKLRASLLTKSKQLYQSGVSDRNADSVLAFVADQLAAKPERADVVHDLLAFLAEQMTALNRDKRAAAKQFLTDLKDFHDINTHALKPKTKLDKFWELEAAGIFAHFRANKIRLKDSDEEKIRARFQKAKDTLVPLASSLVFTDELIDQIVYRLYGLTPEEIELVQASQAAPPADAKTTLFKQVLPHLKEATPYFTTAAVVGRVKELGLKISEGTLPVYLSEATTSGMVHDAGRGWYSRFSQPVPLDPKPVAKLIRTVEKAFPLLDFTVWSTAQINPWMHHLLAQPVAFLYASSDTLESIGDTLRTQGWEVAVDPGKKDGQKVIRPGEKMVVLRSTHSKQPAPAGRQATIEQILVELQVEASRLALIDDSEVQGVVKGILGQYLVQVAELKTYADFRLVKIDALNAIN
jgi:type I restriction-modification system DNA methylase subunit